MDFKYLVDWALENFIQPFGFLQIGVIGLTCLAARILAIRIRQHLEKGHQKVSPHFRFALSPAQFSVVLGYVLWLLLLWFCRLLFEKLQMPIDFLRIGFNLAVAWLVVRFVYFYLKSTFWSRFFYILTLAFLTLKIFKLWDPAVALLGSMTIGLGSISVSVLGLVEAAILFVGLWAAAGAVNRFTAHRLAASERLETSDRVLLQRLIKAVTGTAAVLISLRASGLDLTTLAVTGGAIGFAIGIGLQKVGSNLVGGVMLLLRKPVRAGDVIAFEKISGDTQYGWITEIGQMYVHVATRDGTELLIPNESFVTQKIENLSLSDNLLRLTIPFGISYGSDLKLAISLSVSAAMGIGRVLRNPGPHCLLKEFGDSTVNLMLRIWINDPKNGIHNVKDAVLLAVWDSFHANGIEIAFPQRDLHIKSAVPLRFLKDNLQSGSYDAFRASSDKEKVRESGKSGTDELKMEL